VSTYKLLAQQLSDRALLFALQDWRNMGQAARRRCGETATAGPDT